MTKPLFFFFEFSYKNIFKKMTFAIDEKYWPDVITAENQWNGLLLQVTLVFWGLLEFLLIFLSDTQKPAELRLVYMIPRVLIFLMCLFFYFYTKNYKTNFFLHRFFSYTIGLSFVAAYIFYSFYSLPLRTHWFGVIWAHFLAVTCRSAIGTSILYVVLLIVSLFFYNQQINSINIVGESLLGFIIIFVTHFCRLAWVNASIINLKYIDNLKELSRLQQLKNKNELEISKIASQVAHDIRSPVIALNTAINTLPDIVTDQKELIQNSVIRINQIANDLLSKYKKPEFFTAAFEDRSIKRIIELLVLEKRTQFSEYNIQYVVLIKNSDFLVPEYVSISDLNRILSNLINNAIESFEVGNGVVTIGVEVLHDQFSISIQDTGKGIDSKTLEKIGYRGVSVSKLEGTGFGLAHAKEYMSSITGDFLIESMIGQGTKVTLIFKNERLI